MSFSPTTTSPKKTGLVQPPNSPNPEYKQGKHFCYNHTHTIQSSLLIRCGNPQCRATDIQMKILENKFPGYLIYHDGYSARNNTKNIIRFKNRFSGKYGQDVPIQMRTSMDTTVLF